MWPLWILLVSCLTVPGMALPVLYLHVPRSAVVSLFAFSSYLVGPRLYCICMCPDLLLCPCLLSLHIWYGPGCTVSACAQICCCVLVCFLFISGMAPAVLYLHVPRSAVVSLFAFCSYLVWPRLYCICMCPDLLLCPCLLSLHIWYGPGCTVSACAQICCRVLGCFLFISGTHVAQVAHTLASLLHDSYTAGVQFLHSCC